MELEDPVERDHVSENRYFERQICSCLADRKGAPGNTGLHSAVQTKATHQIEHAFGNFRFGFPTDQLAHELQDDAPFVHAGQCQRAEFFGRFGLGQQTLLFGPYLARDLDLAQQLLRVEGFDYEVFRSGIVATKAVVDGVV